MFGNNPLSTVTFGGEKLRGQGFNPSDPTDELKIFVPGENELGESTDMGKINQGDNGEGVSPDGGDVSPTDTEHFGDGGTDQSYGESWDVGNVDSSY